MITRSLASILWIAALVAAPGCPPKQATPAPAADDGEPDEDPDDDGPIAGPREVVMAEAPPPRPSSDTPGWGPVPPYLAKVRNAVTDKFFDCLASGPAVSATQPALVLVTIGPSGDLRQISVARPSGAEAFDNCILRAFRSTDLPAPPPEALGEGGVVTSEMAFR